MPRLVKKVDPSTAKFGAPLYGVAWLSEALLVVTGGGGKKSSGIPNRRAPGGAVGPSRGRRTAACARSARSARERRGAPACHTHHRLMVLRYEGGKLQPEPVFSLPTGDEPPQRCARPRAPPRLQFCAPNQLCTRAASPVFSPRPAPPRTGWRCTQVAARSGPRSASA